MECDRANEAAPRTPTPNFSYYGVVPRVLAVVRLDRIWKSSMVSMTLVLHWSWHLQSICQAAVSRHDPDGGVLVDQLVFSLPYSAKNTR